MLVLNTNFYYDQNKLTQDMEDPSGQFTWANKVLTEAANNNEKVFCSVIYCIDKHICKQFPSLHQVYIIGHIPPGFFEKKRSKPWFTAQFNEQYLKLIRKHHSVILGQFFGHHHTDSFRMIYDSEGNM